MRQLALAENFQPRPDRPPTLTIMGELLRPYILDAKATFTPNDAADYQHAILASAYCDFILLDGRWQHFLSVAARRIKALQLPFKTAECFSDRRDGVERFLVALESRCS